MKIKYVNEDYYIYITKENVTFSLDDKEALVDYIRKVIIRLKIFYDITLQGFYKIYAYPNKKFGLILRIICIDDFAFESIDLKIVIRHDTDIYLKTDNYFIFKDKNLYYEGFYYKNIKEIDDIYKYIEYCDIYLDENNKIKSITS